MNKYKLMSAVAVMLFSASTLFSQKIHKSDVPSLIINKFNNQFSRAYDVEWEMEKDVYKVEFETGLFRKDHTVWYDGLGNLIMHKAEISKSNLPDAITSLLSTEFNDYKVDDVKMITKGDETTYIMELRRFDEGWKVNISSDGKLLSKIPD